MLWIMRLRGNNNNRVNAPSDNRPARKEYNQLSSKDMLDSSKTYIARDNDNFIETNNGNDSCTESDSNCTDVEDSNDDIDDKNRRRVHRKKDEQNNSANNLQRHSEILEHDQPVSQNKTHRRTRNSDIFFDDDSDCDEALTCNVCDRSFPCQRQLESHQQKKRHFGCSACDSLYLSLMALEHHKEEFQHWSDDEEYCSVGYDSESSDDTAPSEDCERLL